MAYRLVWYRCVEYEEIRLYLHPGDRLLMMSDGVAEARKSNGELFGFDRVRNLSNQSAYFLAEAAKEFGQEDDITVLTVSSLWLQCRRQWQGGWRVKLWSVKFYDLPMQLKKDPLEVRRVGLRQTLL